MMHVAAVPLQQQNRSGDWRQNQPRHAASTMEGAKKMAKYKLEYLWLDGYKPVQIFAEKPKSKNTATSLLWINFHYGVLTAVLLSKPREEAPTAF